MKRIKKPVLSDQEKEGPEPFGLDYDQEQEYCCEIHW